MKAKVRVGIALAFRYAHGHGLLHGSVKASNLFFDAAHRVQLGDFSPISLLNGSVSPFTGAEGAEWNPSVDVCGFACLLAEIASDRTVNSSICSEEDPRHCVTVPEFVLMIIQVGQTRKCHQQISFVDIIDCLKKHDFQILSGVDAKEVSTFVSWVESSEQTGE
jgi:serine/threonine protein kinase